MAVYEVRKSYTDLEKSQCLKSGKRVEATVKRVEYASKRLEEYEIILEGIKKG